MKKLIAPILLVVILGSIIGSMVWVNNNKLETGKDNPIIIVNGETIYQSEYDTIFNQILAMYGLEQSDLDVEMKAEIHEDIIESLIQIKLIMIEARNLGLIPSEEEVDEFMNEMKQDFNSIEEFEEEVASAGFTEETLRNQIRESLAVENYIEYISATTESDEQEITEQDILDYYVLIFGEEDEEGNPPFEDVRDLIISLIEQERSQGAFPIAAIEELRESAQIEILID